MYSKLTKNLLVSLLCISVSYSIEAKNKWKQSQELLQRTLANHTVLLHQTLNYHWNVEGKEFHDYHLMFDKEYKQLFENLDLIAERIRAIDGKVKASMKDFIETASIKEDTSAIPQPKEMVKRLHDQYHLIIEDMRKSVKNLEKSDDVATRKMLEDLIEMGEKTKWMLKSLLKK